MCAYLRKTRLTHPPCSLFEHAGTKPGIPSFRVWERDTNQTRHGPSSTFLCFLCSFTFARRIAIHPRPSRVCACTCMYMCNVYTCTRIITYIVYVYTISYIHDIYCMLCVRTLYTYVALHTSPVIFPLLSVCVVNYTSSLLSCVWRACRGILSHLCVPSHSYVLPLSQLCLALSQLCLVAFFFLKTTSRMQGVGLDEKQKKKCRLRTQLRIRCETSV